MIVINLISGPGAGKSTLGAGLFYHAKKSGANVEFVNEYAKDMVWEDRSNILDDQLYILAKQARRLKRLQDKVDYVITDTSLLLGCHYAREDYYQHFFPLVKEVFDSYNNFNVWVERPGADKYSEIGRTQSHGQALTVDSKLWRTVSRLSRIDLLVMYNSDPAHTWEDIVEKSAGVNNRLAV